MFRLFRLFRLFSNEKYFFVKKALQSKTLLLLLILFPHEEIDGTDGTDGTVY